MPNSPRRHFKSDLTHQIFSWLLVAERPLHRSELLEALEYRARGPPISALAKSNTAVNSAQGLELDIESVCRGLVTVAKEGTVDFSTPSVRKYLLFENSSKHPRRPILEAHELVAWTCLNVIHSKNVESTSLSSSDLLPHGVLATEPLSTLSEYAFANWPFHYRMAEAYSRVLAGTLQRVLAISLNDACKTSSIPHDQRAASIASKTLQIGARYGFPELTKMCLEMGHEANGDACGCCKTALPIALTNGHTGVAEILLQKGAATEPIRYNGSPGMRLLRSAVARRVPDQIEANPERDIEESTSITHSEEISLHLIIQYAL